MPSRVSSLLSRLGPAGTVSLFGTILVFVFLFTAHELIALCIGLFSFPFIIWYAVRVSVAVKRHSLWSLRNRLLFVYALLGVLPLFLIVVLIGLGSWAFMNELAVYLASSALERRLQTLDGAVDAFQRQEPKQLPLSGPEIEKAFDRVLPGVSVYVKDSSGLHCFPATAAPIVMPAGWKSVRGLVVINGRFYGWAHSVRPDSEITVLAPFSDRTVENLVPHLGQIALLENPSDVKKPERPAIAGSLQARTTRDAESPDYKAINMLPMPVNRFDIPVFIASTQMHYHLGTPNKLYSGVLWVRSRPSAVLRSFFTGTDFFRDFLYNLMIGIAVLFLVAELIAISIGVSLSRRITGAVNQLYEGTRRVISGDFRHRIPVRDYDQLGDLAQSFNQMTGNLERLLVVEKEKERLQTEVEIAREVQGQLYPKAAPPTCGLRLTVRCDPARMVSGDYYDYLQTSRSKMVFAIGDVAGKGISAALLMATLQAALRAQLNAYTPVSETSCSTDPEVDCAALVSKLNRQIHAHTSPEKYATFFFAVFDEANCTLTYTNAGHLSPLLFRGDEVIQLDSNGTVVGAFPFAKYDESCLNMNHRDLLVCYTDGITEPENAYGEMFGEERLIELVRKHYDKDDVQIVDIILDAVRSWTGSPELHDDMTLLLARQVGAPA